MTVVSVAIEYTKYYHFRVLIEVEKHSILIQLRSDKITTTVITLKTNIVTLILTI